ncbi:MAG: tRNA dihydrouridine synthase DusB [Spirochaetales bacterium]|nr:tRNA dihydrouridine synthase DusB [Spirochaetales bacterium]
MNTSSILHQIELPGRILPGNIFLAPMAGFTDRAMREICVEAGADLSFSEMVSCEGLIRDNNKTTVLLEHDPECEPCFAVQIFTASPDTAAEAVQRIIPIAPALIDLNCGCPVPKVIKTGAGAALMREPGKIGAIVARMRNALAANPEIAVSVKLRTGWDNSDKQYLEAAAEAQRAGAALISLHGRTRKQGYSGKADWKAIKKLKENSSVPVIGSGDLFSSAAVTAMFEQTGCDGVMIARGAIGNPFIFTRLKNEADADTPEITAAVKLAAAFRQLERAAGYLGEEQACREIRKHVCAYSKGLPGGAALRQSIVHACSVTEYRRCIAEYLDRPSASS